jgi:regulator of protease activity HflC (stomatin/prohibitin superfamily)
VSEQAVVSVVLLALFVVLVLVTLWKAVRVVPVGRAGLVERLGRFTRVAQPGVNLVVPFVDQVRLIDLREQLATFGEPQVDGRILYAVVDPVKAGYESAPGQFADLALAELRELVARIPAAEVPARSQTVEAHLRMALQPVARRCGVEVRGIEISPTSTRSSGR